MARITVEDCIDKFESRFELVLVASNRARKLHSGENPTVDKDNDKNTVIALREIADETINIDDMKNTLIEEYQTQSIQNEEDLTLEYSDSDEQEQTLSDEQEQTLSDEQDSIPKEQVSDSDDEDMSDSNSKISLEEETASNHNLDSNDNTKEDVDTKNFDEDSN